MKLLITGATGFVGKNLNEYFSMNEKYEVYAPNEVELNLIDSDSVDKFLKQHKFDAIIHSATTLRTATAYPADVCENNLKMFFNLARSKSDYTKLINLGSGSEYSRSYWHKKMKEDFFDSHVPEDPHSYSKYIISKYINNSRDLNALTLRIFGIFGKYEDYRYKFISNAIAKNISEMPIIINQNVSYDYIYINDFCRIVEIFLVKKNNNLSYNITPNNSVDLIDIANSVNRCGMRKSEIILLNDGLGVTYSGDNSQFIRDFGEFHFTEIFDAVTELYKYYSQNNFLISKEDLVSDLYLEYAKNLKHKYFKN